MPLNLSAIYFMSLFLTRCRRHRLPISVYWWTHWRQSFQKDSLNHSEGFLPLELHLWKHFPSSRLTHIHKQNRRAIQMPDCIIVQTQYSTQPVSYVKNLM